jgi:hypothetical protein
MQRSCRDKKPLLKVAQEKEDIIFKLTKKSDTEDREMAVDSPEFPRVGEGMRRIPVTSYVCAPSYPETKCYH